MNQAVDLVQGTDEWLRFRSNKIGASEVAVIMGLSEWDTAYSLWLKKTGRKEESKKGETVNFAVARGNRWEGAVRARYELINDIPMNPEVFVHPEYPFISASLDGWNAEKKLVLEIKCAGKEVYQMAKDGVVHPKYCPQLEQQLWVSGGDLAHFYVAQVGTKNGKEQILGTALVEYPSNPDLRKQVEAACLWFWPFVENDTPPPLTETDTLYIEDPNAKETFTRIADLVRKHDAAELAFDLAEGIYLKAKEDYERIDKDLGDASKDITPWVTHPRVRGFGLYVAEKVFKRGKEYHFKATS